MGARREIRAEVSPLERDGSQGGPRVPTAGVQAEEFPRSMICRAKFVSQNIRAT